MIYQSEEQILETVRTFENGTISRTDWGHAEHLLVAAFYAFHYDYETALGKMRGGIFNLLTAFKVDLSKEMPYHETLTVFWMRTIYKMSENCNGISLVETVNKILQTYDDKDLPLKFYSRDLLFSDEARKNFVKGDL